MCGNYGIVLAFRGFGMGFHFCIFLSLVRIKHGRF
jgi:hypothetical protein